MRELITSRPDEPVSDVIHKLKQHDISQMPIITADDRFLGLVNEVDLLNYLVLGTGQDSSNAVAELVRSDVATLGPDAPLSR